MNSKQFLEEQKILGVVFAPNPFTKKEDWSTQFDETKHLVRKTCYHELIIEIDLEKDTPENRLQAEQIQEQNYRNLANENFDVFMFGHHGKSPYLRLYGFEQLKEKNKSEAAKQFIKTYCEKLPQGFSYDESINNETHFCPIEYQSHWRHKHKHEELKHFKGINKITKIELEDEKEFKERKIDLNYWDILKKKNANPSERTSCVMQIYNEHEFEDSKMLLNFVCKHNDWTKFDPRSTKKYIDGIWKKYITPNPIKKVDGSLPDVPTLELIDFSKYDKIFVNTHSHLKSYNLVSENINLLGDDYYALKKCMTYSTESMRQPTMILVCGSEAFDNRLHLVLQGGAGSGKSTCKKIWRTISKDCNQYDNVVEGSGARINIEQLIGKRIKEKKGVEKDVKGYFGFKGIILDEAQSLLCEEDRGQASLMREFRIAMDTFGYNTIEKKLVDNNQPLAYEPFSRVMFLIHDVIFPPRFFDTGSFRRLFCFELKPTKVSQYDTIANLYKQSNENELKQYMNEYISGGKRFPITNITITREGIDEFVKWYYLWNRFVFLNPNQRIRSIFKGTAFSAKNYFFRLINILTLMKEEKEVSIKTIREACRDTFQFLLKTIQIYGNKSTPTLSRDVWKTDDLQEAMVLEWMHYNNAKSREKTPLMIHDVQERIGDVFGVMEKQARRIYHGLKKKGFVDDYQKGGDSRCWMTFEPETDCPINLEDEHFPDLEEEITRLFNGYSPEADLTKRPDSCEVI